MDLRVENVCKDLHTTIHKHSKYDFTIFYELKELEKLIAINYEEYIENINKLQLVDGLVFYNKSIDLITNYENLLLSKKYYKDVLDIFTFVTVSYDINELLNSINEFLTSKTNKDIKSITISKDVLSTVSYLDYLRLKNDSRKKVIVPSNDLVKLIKLNILDKIKNNILHTDASKNNYKAVLSINKVETDKTYCTSLNSIDGQYLETISININYGKSVFVFVMINPCRFIEYINNLPIDQQIFNIINKNDNIYNSIVTYNFLIHYNNITKYNQCINQ